MEEAKKKESGKRLFSLKYFVVFIVIFAVIIIIFLFLNFRTKNCSNIDCFNSAMEKCKRASFINELEDASWLYTINGKKGDLCKINVKLLQVKEGTTETKIDVKFIPIGEKNGVGLSSTVVFIAGEGLGDTGQATSETKPNYSIILALIVTIIIALVLIILVIIALKKSKAKLKKKVKVDE